MVLTDHRDGIDIVSFETDRINALNADEIRASIGKLFENSHSRLLIDLSGVTYFDSSGFSMLLLLLRAARSNYCSMRLCCLTPSVESLFETLRLNTSFDIYPDFETCFESYKRGGPA